MLSLLQPVRDSLRLRVQRFSKGLMVDFTAKPIDGCEAPALGTPPSGEPTFWKEESSLREGLALQARVIRALMLREVRTLYGRHRLGYLWAFFEPLLHMSFWFVLFIFIRRAPSVYDMSPLLFLACGLIPFFCFRNVGTFVQGAISSNSALLQFPPVRQVDTIISRFLLKSATMVVVGVGIFGVMIFTGVAGWPSDSMQVLLATLAMLFFGLGFGSFNCMICVLYPAYSKFSNVVNRVFYFTSGLFFIPEMFPPNVLEYLSWNPALHGVGLFRSGWSSLYESQEASWNYLLTASAILLLLGLVLEPMVKKIRESE
jgi:capsular polysaccharide transport system permease protein